MGVRTFRSMPATVVKSLVLVQILNLVITRLIGSDCNASLWIG